MKFIIIFGPRAVGKMTVGHELEKITDLKLFHNHMTIDLVAPFFSYGTGECKRLVDLFREEIFKAVAKSDIDGLIFTFVWNFSSKDDTEYVEEISSIFTRENGDVYLVELEADLEERVARNKTPHRLLHKPSKRNLDHSEAELIRYAGKYRQNSTEGEIEEKNYLSINNTNIDAEAVAAQIKENFKL